MTPTEHSAPLATNSTFPSYNQITFQNPPLEESNCPQLSTPTTWSHQLTKWKAGTTTSSTRAIWNRLRWPTRWWIRRWTLRRGGTRAMKRFILSSNFGRAVMIPLPEGAEAHRRWLAAGQRRLHRQCRLEWCQLLNSKLQQASQALGQHKTSPISKKK